MPFRLSLCRAHALAGCQSNTGSTAPARCGIRGRRERTRELRVVSQPCRGAARSSMPAGRRSPSARRGVGRCPAARTAETLWPPLSGPGSAAGRASAARRTCSQGESPCQTLHACAVLKQCTCRSVCHCGTRVGDPCRGRQITHSTIGWLAPGAGGRHSVPLSDSGAPGGR